MSYNVLSMILGSVFAVSLALMRLLGPEAAFSLNPNLRRLLLGLSSAGAASGVFPLVLGIEKITRAIRTKRSAPLFALSMTLFLVSLFCLFLLLNFGGTVQAGLYGCVGGITGFASCVFGRRLFDTLNEMTRVRFVAISIPYVGGIGLVLGHVVLTVVLLPQ